LYYFYRILTAFNKLKIMSEVVLLLPNTDHLQQAEDYVRGCTTSTEYWLPSTSWRLCQRLYYFYRILTAFNKLKIMSEVAHDNWKRLKLFKGVIIKTYISSLVHTTCFWNTCHQVRSKPDNLIIFRIMKTKGQCRIYLYARYVEA
jgi:hypothetical protein